MGILCYVVEYTYMAKNNATFGRNWDLRNRAVDIECLMKLFEKVKREVAPQGGFLATISFNEESSGSRNVIKNFQTEVDFTSFLEERRFGDIIYEIQIVLSFEEGIVFDDLHLEPFLEFEYSQFLDGCSINVSISDEKDYSYIEKEVNIFFESTKKNWNWIPSHELVRYYFVISFVVSIVLYLVWMVSQLDLSSINSVLTSVIPLLAISLVFEVIFLLIVRMEETYDGSEIIFAGKSVNKTRSFQKDILRIVTFGLKRFITGVD